MKQIAKEINPFDLLSGKVVKNGRGTFWFKKAGNNVNKHGLPVWENLHRLDGTMYTNLHRVDGPAIIWFSGKLSWYTDGRCKTKLQVLLRYYCKKIKIAYIFNKH